VTQFGDGRAAHMAKRVYTSRQAMLALTTVIAVALAASLESCSKGKSSDPAPMPVVVSHPLVRELDNRQGYLGQLSAIDLVEIRAQVGGTLQQIAFKDGEVVHKGSTCLVQVGSDFSEQFPHT
jgi:multidrug efflux pump subunit AcrA (membrane-fusion protein)